MTKLKLTYYFLTCKDRLFILIKLKYLNLPNKLNSTENIMGNDPCFG